MSEAEISEITMDHFYDELRQRVSVSNAKILLQSAVVKSGLISREEGPMSKADVKAICLELIKNGGPAFQVGTTIYGRVQ